MSHGLATGLYLKVEMSLANTFTTSPFTLYRTRH